MTNPIPNFIGNAKGFTKNPLGIIALFISLIYGMACLVLAKSDNLHSEIERLPIVWFIVIFPVLILGVFTFLVIFHHKKLYGPSDFKDESNFVNLVPSNKEVPRDLDRVIKKLEKSTSAQNDSEIKEVIEEIEKIKEKTERISITVPISYLWRLNHWGSNCAKVDDNKMIFSGNSAPNKTDGSHFDLLNILEIGKSYEVSCSAKSEAGTNARFQLWCHDITDGGISVTTEYKTPSTDGDKVGLVFQPSYSKNLRIHLQYEPGAGRIEISDVRITEMQLPTFLK